MCFMCVRVFCVVGLLVIKCVYVWLRVDCFADVLCPFLNGCVCMFVSDCCMITSVVCVCVVCLRVRRCVLVV